MNNIIYIDKDDNDNALNNFKYVVVEVKLSNKKVIELIDQIKLDKEVVEQIIGDNILYAGFLNSEHINIDIKKKLKD